MLTPTYFYMSYMATNIQEVANCCFCQPAGGEFNLAVAHMYLTKMNKQAVIILTWKRISQAQYDQFDHYTAYVKARYGEQHGLDVSNAEGGEKVTAGNVIPLIRQQKRPCPRCGAEPCTCAPAV